MLTAAVLTIALALAIGPQLQLGLQTVIDEPQRVIEEPAAEDVTEPAADLNAQIVEAETDQAPAPQSGSLEELNQQPEAEVSDSVEVQPTVSEPEPIAQTQSGQVDEAEWPVILSQMRSALSSARTAKGNFVQTNADGSVTTGTFALNRPGRMRFDYDDPTPILIVSNGTTVAMEDSELETVDRVPIGSAPLGLILSTDLGFDDDVDVLNVMRNEDRVGVRVSDATGELEGTLTMVFDAQNYDLLGWLAIDGNLQTTVVDLVDVETNVRVDPRLFRLDDAEDEEDER